MSDEKNLENKEQEKEIKNEFKKFSWKIILLSFFNFIGYFLTFN